MRKIAIVILTLCISSGVYSQSFDQRTFKESDGLFERFIYSLEQAPNGYLLAGTANGLYRFDGNSFSIADTSDGLPNSFITASERVGDHVYFGHFDGAISKTDGTQYHLVYPGGANNERVVASAHNAEHILFLRQNGTLVNINIEGVTEIIEVSLDGALPKDCLLGLNNDVFIATDLGLARYDFSSSSLSWESALDGNDITALHSTNQGAIAVAMAGFGLVSYDPTLSEFTPLYLNSTTASWEVTDMCYRHNALWVATNKQGLFRLDEQFKGEYQRAIEVNKGLKNPVNSTGVLFLDREENLWIGSNGEGLMMLSDDVFRLESLGGNYQINDILTQQNSCWLASDKGLLQWNTEMTETTAMVALPDSASVSQLSLDDSYHLWLGTEDHGLYCYDHEEGKFEKVRLSDDRLNQRVNDILNVGAITYVATDFGVYQIRENRVISHLTMQSGLPHNVVKTLFQSTDGTIWIGTRNNGLVKIESGVMQAIDLNQEQLIDVLCIDEDQIGDVWIGTSGGGVLKIDERGVHTFDRSSGLFSDYCYAIHASAEGFVWTGHKGGISRIGIEEGQIRTFATNELGLESFTPNSVGGDRYGRILFASDQGLLSYNPVEDMTDQVAPLINLTMVSISDSLYPLNSAIELPSGSYRFDIGFVGISFLNSDQVRYEYFLDGHDLSWSDPVEESHVRYPRLDHGSYTFRVRALDESGQTNGEEAQLNIYIAKPFWKEWWFFFFVIFVVFITARIVVKRREFVMVQNQERLQKELDVRTREVVKQKELLEITNKDITDSIRYAKNIQKAILPEPDSLQSHFRDSFVFYKPRDIVSGDFYWVEKFGSKVLIACADCTGHGVPGAFMSMIGTVLLKDVSKKHNVWSPDELLYNLDKELTEMLYNENSPFTVRDGMDISIVEYDHDTSMLRFSSAKRPVVVYRDGVRSEIKGDRHSVGGTGLGMGKRFTLHQMKLSPGDIFYQFSDGISDQFGGENGKKLKKSGLMQIFDSIHNLSLDVQRSMLHQRYFEWKGHHPQIDDIIVLGVRV
ncbi:SpoIIE family protein phosphatase [Sanyastnella coralliicola]|uniref:SpoIIE family protein phosphatase n=1 Tax=Sanyastnella coralliicola TaxID=3069118 RepID=UPI0027BA5479|nr:SpoIIE family protein phosphatase [Longitalea sp. SCSIO 12813]